MSFEVGHLLDERCSKLTHLIFGVILHFPLHCQFSSTLQRSLKPLFHLTSNSVVKLFAANIHSETNIFPKISFLLCTHLCVDYKI